MKEKEIADALPKLFQQVHKQLEDATGLKLGEDIAFAIIVWTDKAQWISNAVSKAALLNSLRTTITIIENDIKMEH